ncbi:bifunctional methylenetetrahydrofolate dehydrogenase/methenyltetrahydrofolate cyclohydrolase [Candidatus Shapirobacteria bacterium]|nr:bifunctional methylenetetrahydrofolate dehydrogenase/methenyltetrahydrofolate cyclohydrolase [Candidatus Shapirobacteria bacterium]
MTTIFNGQRVALEKEEILRRKWRDLGEKKNKELVDILIGESKAGKIYLDLKKRAAHRVGINFKEYLWPGSLTKKEVMAKINDLNNDERVGGIMMQLPLPDILRPAETEIVNTILPDKDVDCLTAANLGFLMMGRPRLLPATVRGIAEILSFAGLGQKYLIGKNACILGKSNIVGKPLAVLLINKGATVTVLSHGAKNVASFTKKADLLISATGEKGLIRRKMIKKGAVVIDAGAPAGDVDFSEVAPLASFITPVPGGVGPITVVSLLFNFYDLVSH